MRATLRLFYILWIMASYRLDQVIPARHLRWVLRILAFCNPLTWFRHKPQSRAQRLRLALIKLGPLFVKFGQVLSTRPDLLPADIVTELAKLQDQVPPFSTREVKNILSVAYTQPLTEIFAEFEWQPLASASIAQVHTTTLIDGSDVVVKIVRPNIQSLIKRDVAVLYLLARLANKVLPKADYLHLDEVVAEFEATLLRELDMRLEAENATRLKQNFADSDLLYVPKIYWPLVRSNILVLERIYGIRISDIAQLKQRGANFKKLAEDGVKIFYTQVFRDKFFHADMHPGNIFVDVSNPNKPVYCGVDFGIMGTLTDNDQYYLGENFLAFFNRDYRRVALLHIESGWVPADTSVADFEVALRAVFDPMFRKPINEVSFGQVMVNLLAVAQQFNMHVQPQLVLLQKTLLNVEGLGRQLYPQLDLWQTAKPQLEAIMRRPLSFADRFNWLKQQVQGISFKLEQLPDTISKVLDVISQH